MQLAATSWKMRILETEVISVLLNVNIPEYKMETPGLYNGGRIHPNLLNWRVSRLIMPRAK
jgi:hypothetical protein